MYEPSLSATHLKPAMTAKQAEQKQRIPKKPPLKAQVNAFAPDHDEDRTRRPVLRAAAKLALCTQTSCHGTEAELW